MEEWGKKRGREWVEKKREKNKNKKESEREIGIYKLNKIGERNI